MNKYLTLASTTFMLFLFMSCKKETNLTVNRSSVSVLSMRAELDSSGTDNIYTLKGEIIAPTTVEVIEFGFIIKNNPIEYIPLGSGKKLGYFEATYNNYQNFLYDEMIVFYIVFPDGDTLRSDETNNLNLPNPVLSGFLIDPVTTGETNLYLTINYNVASGYFIGSETLFYREKASTGFYSTFNLPISPGFSSFLLNTLIPNLISGTEYEFYVEVIFYPPYGSTLSPIYSSTPHYTSIFK